jgi:hypothetical protein
MMLRYAPPYIKPKRERKTEKKKKKATTSGGVAKKPKGNGINDSLVRWLCVYAVVFWFFYCNWACASHLTCCTFFV